MVLEARFFVEDDFFPEQKLSFINKVADLLNIEILEL